MRHSATHSSINKVSKSVIASPSQNPTTVVPSQHGKGFFPVNSNEEVNPLSSGTEEVCAPTPAKGVCIKCGQPFEKKGNRKTCYVCLPAQPAKGTPEFAQYNRELQDRHKSLKKSREAEEAQDVDSLVVPSEERKREILTTERNLRHPHVINVCLALAVIAAQCLGIADNEHLYRFGVQKTLAVLAHQKASNLRKPVIPATRIDSAMDRWEPGQRIRVHEQYAIWDFSLSWRTHKNARLADWLRERGCTDSTKVDFESFQELRRICQTNTYEAGRLVHGKDFAEKPHKQWNDEL